jgi:glucose/arabinose dehydrogenase
MRRGLFLLALFGCGTSSPGTATGPVAGPSLPPGLKHWEVRAADLPQPSLNTLENPPRVVARPAGASLVMPPGFDAKIYADGFSRARWMAVAPNGDVFVTDAAAGTLIVLRDADGDGRPEGRFTFASGLALPFGIAFHGSYVYVANTNAVVRFAYADGQTQATGAPETVTTLPGQGYNQHWTRNVAFSPDGSKMYVTVGSQTNHDVEPEPRASVLEMNPDGSGRRTFASGTRNPVGLAFHPQTKALWVGVQERDGLGDDLAPDYITQLRDGGFYGWPYSYAGSNPDPHHTGERPDLVQSAIVPDVLIQAHSSALGLVFYDGKMFPGEYTGDAFVALHGSWNRSKRTGYKLVRVRMKDGRPVGGYDDFLVGWMLDESRAEVWGRPVGLAVAKDGALLVADDGANVIWRVTYAK